MNDTPSKASRVPAQAQIQTVVDPKKTAYIQDMLHEDEKLLRVSEMHVGIYWKAAATAVFALFLLLNVTNLGLFMLVVTAAVGSYAYLLKYYWILALTDKRVIMRQGILQHDTIQMRHGRIESVEVERPIMGRILGYGTILITGTGSRVTAVPFIGDAEGYCNELDEILYEQEEAHKK